MATPKKPVGKAASKKPAPAPAKKKAAVAKAAPVKKAAATPKSAVANKAAQPKAAAKKAPVKASPAKAAPAKKVASPAKAAAAKKAEVPKKTAPAAAPKKAAAPVKSAPAPKKAVAKPAPAPQKKAPAAPPAKPAPVKKVEPKKEEAPVVAAKPVPTKKETQAERKAALKRTASAVQRVQARIATSIPKPQPKPAPLPTVMPGRDEKKSNVVIAHRKMVNKPKEEEASTSFTMTEYQPEFKRSILDKEEKETGPTYRYSDEDLAEFKELITGRLATARRELAYQQGLITHKDATGTDDTENRYMNMEDGSGAMEREQLAQLASRQIQFINHLEKALIRIENKTYGICRVTGKLIDKARLRAVPHATLSIEAKNLMSNK
jgi:RNA polymerase-binding transcription factor DksA